MTHACKSFVCNPGHSHDGWINPKVSPEIRQQIMPLVLTNDQLKKVSAIFLDNIERGLKKATNPEAMVKCYPTYVQDLPDGTEQGKFLALDLGGTNFRVLLVQLKGEKCDMESKIYPVPHELMIGTGEALFDHIAACLADFANEQGVINDKLPLGFTFSFPLEQRGLSVGICQKWTKGYTASGVVGEDVVQLLNKAIQKRGDINIDVCAVLNDTTGTLMSCAWKNRDTKIGLIVGTGNNGCYLEKQSNAELFNEPDMGSGKVIINLEMGGFGDDGCLDFLRTDVDKAVGAKSPNVGWTMEKMISGMFLGEIVRLYMLRFIQQGLLFGGKGEEYLQEEEAFGTKYISQVEMDPPGSYKTVGKLLKDMGFRNATEQDYINVKFICEAVSRRAANLAAATMTTLIHKIGDKKIVIGVDGSVYRFHPHFRNYMLTKMKQLVDPSINFDLMLSEDGSGRGAAIVAAVAARKKQK